MQSIKNLIKKYFNHFTYFYQQLRHRLFISLLLSISVGALDGLGLAMFLPLLQTVDGSAEGSADGMGNLSFLIDGLEGIGLPLTITTILMVMLFFFLLKGAAKFIEGYYKVILNQYFIRKIRYENIDRLSNYSFKAFVNSDAGHLQNTLSGEVGRVNNAYRAYMNVIQAIVMVVVYIFLAFLSNPQFAILVTIGGFISNLVYKQIYKKTKENSRELVKQISGFQGQLIQVVAFFKYFKATGLIKRYGNKLRHTADEIENVTRQMGLYNSILSSTREPLVITVVISVILIQTTVMGQGMGAIVLSLLFFYRSLTYVMNMQNYWNTFMNFSGSLENMTEFMLDLKKNKDIYGKQKFASFVDHLELNDVSFQYGTNEPVVKNVYLKIPKNNTVAFVGESGSGKTTMVNILAGLLPPSKGEYYIDGNKSSCIYIPSFQSRIGYITQEPVIFSDTIYNNVTFWAEKSEMNLKRFWEALEKAAIADFVKGLPEKESTQLGNNGILVSGGQKQRFSIARELFKDIDILIMDEATSALDSETEKAIQENIDALKGQYTILIVAHRLATIKNADKIIIMNHGFVEAEGSFQNLKTNSSAFDRMIKFQEV